MLEFLKCSYGFKRGDYFLELGFSVSDSSESAAPRSISYSMTDYLAIR